MAPARKHHPDAFHHLLGVLARRRMMGVEDDCHLRAGHHRIDGEPLNQPVARHLERNVEQSFERRPGVDDVVAVDDDLFHQRRRGICAEPKAMSSESMPATFVTARMAWKNACATEGTNQSTMKTPMIPIWPNLLARSWAEYGSHGRMMPKPSSPGIGRRFSTRAK